MALGPRSFRRCCGNPRVWFFKLSPKDVQLRETRKINSFNKNRRKTELESAGRKKKIETGGWETKNYKVHQAPPRKYAIQTPAAKAASLRREGIQAHSHRQQQRSLIKSNQPLLPPPRFLLQSSQVRSCSFRLVYSPRLRSLPHLQNSANRSRRFVWVLIHQSIFNTQRKFACSVTLAWLSSSWPRHHPPLFFSLPFSLSFLSPNPSTGTT